MKAPLGKHRARTECTEVINGDWLLCPTIERHQVAMQGLLEGLDAYILVVAKGCSAS